MGVGPPLASCVVLDNKRQPLTRLARIGNHLGHCVRADIFSRLSRQALRFCKGHYPCANVGLQPKRSHVAVVLGKQLADVVLGCAVKPSA